MPHKLLLLTEEQQDFAHRIQSYNFSDLELYVPQNEKEILEAIQDAEIIFGNPKLTSKYINKAKKLTWMQSTFAGIDALNTSDLKKDYILTNMKDAYGEIMSEYVLWYILMLEKNILWNYYNQQKKIWGHTSYPSLVGKKIGIMGIGSIGGKIALSAKNFWMQVYGYATVKREQKWIDKVFTHENIHEFLGNLDYLVSVLPSTSETQGIINTNLLKKLPQKAVFINVGRGANVVEEDLVYVLQNKIISWAVLDVFKQEPLPQNSPLWELENLYITPHVSWYREDNSVIVDVFIENYKRYSEWKELLYIIDFTKWY